MDKPARNRMAILDALARQAGPAHSRTLAEALNAAGYRLNERTVRLYLRQLDEEGLTESHGRRGRLITEKGIAELRAARTLQRIGYLSARIDQMTYGMTFDLATCSGLVVVNTSVVSPRLLMSCMDNVCAVFAQGHAMGDRVGLLAPGESLGNLTVPKDRVGLCTVCSITLNGVLLKQGIPTASRFGGLLELQNGHATRFVEIIHYDATTIDPLEVFIRSGMTNYTGAIATGNGLIGASYREMPEDSRDLVVSIAEQLSAIGLGGFMEIARPGQTVLEIQPSQGRIGSLVIGGLNPIAIVEEQGSRVVSRALAGLLDYDRLFHFHDLPRAVQAHCDG